MKHFPKDWLPILLLIAMIAYSVSVEVIEDGTPEKEDMAKALALGKRFFWRTMMKNWECNDEKVALGQVEKRANSSRLRQICERWKVKALATDAFLKSWESHQGALSSSSSANIPNNQIKVEKPLFRVAGGRELQLSSAMEAIKAAYRVLFGWRSAAGFDTVFDFMNLSDFLHINNAQKISPKGKLNPLNFEEEMENGQKRKYLDEYYEKNRKLRKDMANLLDEIKKENEKETKKEKKEKKKEMLIDNPNAIRSDGWEIKYLQKVNALFLEYWDSIQELGLDMEMICKEVKNYENEHMDDPNVYKQFLDEILWVIGNMRSIHFSIIRLRVTNPEEMIEEKYVGKTFYIYKQLIRDPIIEKYPTKKLKKLQDPCKEAKLKVKKAEGPSSSGSGVGTAIRNRA